MFCRNGRALIGMASLLLMLGEVRVLSRDQIIPPQSANVRVQKRSGDLLFDPTHPAPVSYQDDTVSLQLDASEQKLAVLIRYRGQSPKRVQLPDEMAQVNEIRRATPTRASVVGMVSGDAYELAVLDLPAGALEDRFLAYEPGVSPDGHFVAFIKFYPSHFIEGVDDHYMLYDLALTASENRPVRVSTSDRVDAGRMVYPPGENKEGDNTGVSPADAHTSAIDTFFWNSTSDRYVFADKYHNILSLVMVGVLGKNSAQSEKMDISQQELCQEIQRETCEVHLSSVEFDAVPPGGIRASFRGIGEYGSLTKQFHLYFDQFRVVN